MNALLEKDENFKKDYGLQKIWHKTLNEYVGVMGLIRNATNIVEGGIFLKSQYIGSGIGFWAEKCLFDNLERVNGVMVASAWEENKVAIKLMLKNGMNFVNQIQKSYNNNSILVNVYIKFAKNYVQ